MKNITKKLGLCTVLFGSLLCVSSLNAETLPARGPISFSTYDTNGDGFVTEKEFYDVRAKRIQQKVEQGMPMRNVGNAPDFSQFDANGDGKLTETELLKGQNAQMQNRRLNKGGYGQGGMGKGMNQGMGKGMN
jgi:Ca2+-binding EF-hand superfamily protein